MKRKYEKIIMFFSFIFITLILNSFVTNVLTSYKMSLYLFFTTIIFHTILGLEKDNHRYTLDIIFETIIYMLIFFLLYYILGIVIGFAKTGNYYTLNNFTKFVLPLIINIILKEYLRYQTLRKVEYSIPLIVVDIILFTFLDITNYIYHGDFTTTKSIFLFIALIILPAISRNIACSYITYKTGYKPSIVFLLLFQLYEYLLPIIPNPNEYILSVITFTVPIFLSFRIYNSLRKDYQEDIDRDYRKRKAISYVLPTIMIIILVYLTSGYFHYYAVAVASGSMSPNIYKGDVVIIEKTENQFDKLKEGEVLAYKYNEVIIVHRLVEIIKINDKYYFYTQGDANKERDNFIITEDMVIGTVNLKIPLIGYPTVWINSL